MLKDLHATLVNIVENNFIDDFETAIIKKAEHYYMASKVPLKCSIIGTLTTAGTAAVAVLAPSPITITILGANVAMTLVEATCGAFSVIASRYGLRNLNKILDAWDIARTDLYQTIQFCMDNNFDIILEPFEICDVAYLYDNRKNQDKIIISKELKKRMAAQKGKEITDPEIY